MLELNADGSPAWTDGYVTDPGNAPWLALDAPAAAGDTLWVREAFRFADSHDHVRPSHVDLNTARWWFAADESAPAGAGKLRPGIHMPSGLCRILLNVLDVRLERLQDITADDAIAEGLILRSGGWTPDPAVHGHLHPVTAYRVLWESLHGAGSWDLNPRVWRMAFEIRT